MRPVLGPEADELWLLYQTDPDSRQTIEGFLHVLAQEQLEENYRPNQILLPPPPEEVARGDFPLGTVLYGKRELYPFGLRERELTQHMGICGMTGTGKTSVGFVFLKTLLERGLPFMVFDWKRSWRDILQWPQTDKVRVFTVGRKGVAPFHWNVLTPPPGTTNEVWLKLLIDLLMANYYLGEGVAILLQKAFDAVYRANRASWPTMAEAKRWLEAYTAKGRQAQWMDSASRVMEALCFGPIGDVLNSGSPSRLDDLLKQQVIFELDDLNHADKGFFIQALLLWIHRYRMQEGGRESSLKHVLIIEEAHHVLLRNDKGRESMMDVLWREARELSGGLVFLDQCPSLISTPAMANSFCTIGMNLKNGRDVSSLARAMLLKDDEKDYLGQLPVGHGIVRLQGRWQKPFLVKFPLLPLQKGSISDDHLQARFRGFSTDSPDLSPLQPEPAEIPPLAVADKTRAGNLIEAEKQLLTDIVIHRFSSVTSRYSRLSLSGSLGNKTQRTLLQRGLIKACSIKTPNGLTKMFELTEAGEQAAQELGLTVSKRKGRESLEHDYWKHKLGERLAQNGYSVEIEYLCKTPSHESPHYIDLVATKGDDRLAIEVETGKSNFGKNTEKCVSAGFSKIFVVALSKDAQKTIERWLDGQPKEIASGVRLLSLHDAVFNRWF